MSRDVIFLLLVPTVLIAIDYLNGALLIGQLRREFPTLWGELDEPSLDAANYASARLKLAAFIWTGKFLRIQSKVFILRCFVALFVQVALVACLGYGLATTST
jgi:hypothetical protein